ncbi:MAG: tRNA 2-selenouridine(34) synthase MnmH [Pseudomonadales bacterium]
MANRPDLTDKDFKQLFIDDVPLMDVRAPVEFESGAFPCAVNLPILDNQQRHEIGTVYKAQGQKSAIARGQALATETVRAQRLLGWTKYVENNSTGYMYCFRGGLRSRTTQQWLHERGYDYPLISGGYKALRSFLLGELERLCNNSELILLAGATATGKTDLLYRYKHSLDLEGRANHRGSAFGSTFTPQPAQIDFENAIIIDWLKLENNQGLPILIEAESRLIGRLCLPPSLQEAMQRSQVIELRACRVERVKRLRRDYIEFALSHFQAHAEQPWQELSRYVQSALDRIQKRLGGAKHKELSALLPVACNELREQSAWQSFDLIFSELLDHYYDKMYDYQLQKQSDQMAFSGEASDVLDYMSRNYSYV